MAQCNSRTYSFFKGKRLASPAFFSPASDSGWMCSQAPHLLGSSSSKLSQRDDNAGGVERFLIQEAYFEKYLSNKSLDSFAPSSVNKTDLAFVAGSEM
jgi:hypothetical protein